MKTRDEYMAIEKEELGEVEFNSMFHVLDNEYYEMIEKEVKAGKTISQNVYESLTDGQRFHFNKHYNHRGDKVN